MPSPIHKRLLSAAFFWLVGVWLFFAQIAPSHAQTVALTFDDGFDVVSAGQQGVADNAAMLATLKQHKVRSMLFPSGVAMGNPDNMALVQAWSQEGHAIGNHTYNHDPLSKTDTAAYFLDVERAQSILQALPGWCPRLRFPYLDEGGNPEQHNEAMNWLAQHGYGVAAATISLSDWEFSMRYLDLLQSGSPAEAEAFRKDYVKQIIAQVQAQEKHWIKILKRSPAHVLLLHTNHLNAAVLPDLLQALQRLNWTIIDPAKAFEDPIYQRSYIPFNSADKKPVPLPLPACH